MKRLIALTIFVLLVFPTTTFAAGGAEITKATPYYAMPDATVKPIGHLQPNPMCPVRYEIVDDVEVTTEATTPTNPPIVTHFYLLERGQADLAWVLASSVKFVVPFTTPVCGNLAGDLGLPPDAKAQKKFKRLIAKLHIVSAKLHKPLYLNAGYRTKREQAVLYQNFLAGHGAPADPPGKSHHQWGIAADVEIGTKYQADHANLSLGNNRHARRIATNLGLVFPHPAEPWHVELG